MLEEIGFEYKVTKLDLSAGDQFKPDFKKISPFSKIPAIIDYSNGDLDAARDILTVVVRQKDSTYSPLALYFIIDNNLKDRKQVNDLFEVLINKTSLEDEIKNLIIYKKALYNADFFKENELLGTLKPVLNSDSVWKSHALYLVAEYLYSKESLEV